MSWSGEAWTDLDLIVDRRRRTVFSDSISLVPANAPERSARSQARAVVVVDLVASDDHAVGSA
jgi:hypothetical protein